MTRLARNTAMSIRCAPALVVFARSCSRRARSRAKRLLRTRSSSNFLAGAPGRVLVFNDPVGTVLTEGLNAPTSLALDSTAGKLYIASRTDGKIMQVSVGQ